MKVAGGQAPGRDDLDVDDDAAELVAERVRGRHVGRINAARPAGSTSAGVSEGLRLSNAHVGKHVRITLTSGGRAASMHLRHTSVAAGAPARAIQVRTDGSSIAVPLDPYGVDPSGNCSAIWRSASVSWSSGTAATNVQWPPTGQRCQRSVPSRIDLNDMNGIHTVVNRWPSRQRTTTRPSGPVGGMDRRVR